MERIISTSEVKSAEVNGTWTGTAGLLQSGVADMELYFAPYNEDADKIVEYLWVNRQLELSIVHREMISTLVPDVMEPLFASEPQVWFIALAALVVVTLVTYMANQISAPVTREQFQDNNLITVFQMFLYQGSPRWPRRVCNQILLTFYMFYVMVFICSVYATMKQSASFTMPRVYKTVQDIVDDNLGKSICIDVEERASSVFESTNRLDYLKFWNHVVTTPGAFVLAGSDFLLNYGNRLIAGLENDQRVVGEPFVLNFILTMICHETIKRNMMLMIFTEHVSNGQFYSYRLRKDLEADKRRHILGILSRLTEIGLFDRLLDSLAGNYEVTCTSSTVDVIENPMDSLELASLSNTVKLWLCGLIIATVCFLIELIVSCIKRAVKRWQENKTLHVSPRDHRHGGGHYLQ